MATANDLLDKARSQLGYDRFNDPKAGTIYGRWFAEQTGVAWYGASGVPYCAMFVSWCLAQVGVSCCAMPTASVGTMYRTSKAQGKFHAGASGIVPGAVIVYDWGNGDGGHDHTGICESVGNGIITAIEGNTSGGKVMRRTRSVNYVQGWIMPEFSAASKPSGGTSGSTSGVLEVDGYLGFETHKRGQSLAHTCVDGYIDGQNPQSAWRMKAFTQGINWVQPDGKQHASPYVEAIQKKLGCTPDGIIGKDTINAMISYCAKYWNSGATECDGKLDLGGCTAKAIQRMYNAGRFWD